MIKIPTRVRSQIESKFEDINLLLSSCNPFATMFGIKNLSSDLRAEVDTRKNISREGYISYNDRLEKMILDTEKTCICILDTEKTCICHKRK